MPDVTGTESPEEILRIVLSEFEFEAAEIVYEEDVPYLKVQHNVPTDYVCKYRLDKLLLPLFDDAKSLYEQYASHGFLQDIDPNFLICMVAYVKMSNYLSFLVPSHPLFFLELDDQTILVSETIFLQSQAVVRGKDKDEATTAKLLSQIVREQTDLYLNRLLERRRKSVVGFMNRLPLITVPSGKGRPPGTTKSDAQKQQDAADFKEKVKGVIRTLYEAQSKLPTKTAVAEALHLGGPETRLSAFQNKLNRLKLDYKAIIEELDLHK